MLGSSWEFEAEGPHTSSQHRSIGVFHKTVDGLICLVLIVVGSIPGPEAGEEHLDVASDDESRDEMR